MQTTTPFQKINDAVKTTGLSAYYLRNGCKNGTIPHIMSGKKYLINVPSLLSQLGALSNKEKDENINTSSHK